MAYISSTTSDIEAYTPISTSGSVTYSTGDTDWSEVVDALVDAQSFKLDSYDEDIAEQTFVLSQLESLQSAVSEFTSALDDLDSMDKFLDVKVSGGGDALEVTADSTAKTGSHTIVVNQLAKNDVWISDTGSAASTDSITDNNKDGKLEFTINGKDYAINVTEGTTLDKLVDQINADSSVNDLVEASVIYDGSKYFFALSSLETGTENAISNITLTNLTFGMDNTQTACDAELKVDGFAITRSSNEIDDVIEGLTLNLSETTGTDGVRISASYDTSALTETIEEFVNATNQILYDIQVVTGKVETTYETSDGETEIAPTINSYALDLMYAELKSMISATGIGFEHYNATANTGDVYASLSQIGISTDADENSESWGLLLLDTDELEDAIANDPKAVAALFADNESVSIDGSGLMLDKRIDGMTKGGTYTVEYTVDKKGEISSATIDGMIIDIELYLDKVNNIITIPAGSDAVGLSLKVTETKKGDYSCVVGVKEGKISELNRAAKQWNSADGGTLSIVVSSMESSIDSVEDDIYDEEARLDTLRTSLLRKYSALETLLGTYSALEETVSQLSASLRNNNSD